MPDVLKNPRVQALLRQIGDNERLLAQLPDPAVADVVDALLMELGRAVVQFAAQHASYTLVPEDDSEGMVTHDLYTDEVPADDNSWYTHEVPRPGRVFDPGDLPDDDTDVPEPDPRPPAERDDTTDSAPLPTLALHQYSHLPSFQTAPPPNWLGGYGAFRELLTPPADLEDPAELAVEASKVQWAVGELEHRAGGWPNDVRAALIGLLAARAQALRAGVDIDVGPRLALDRLSRYRLAADLPLVAGLKPVPRPELGAWEDDVRAWWTLLDPATR